MEYIWLPEHLLTAAVNSWLMTTFLAIAENSKLEFTDFACDARGKLEQIEGKFLITEAHLFPKLVLKNEVDKDKDLHTLQKSEAACLISNAIKSKETIAPTIIVGA
jgi:organic hydroperoxide reductase OsmC/OhrA